MRVFLAGEGPHDIGGLSRGPGQPAAPEPGVLHVLVGRAVPRPVTRFTGEKLMLLHDADTATAALTRHACAAVRLARLDRADVLVTVTDVDATPGQVATPAEAASRHARLRSHMQQGFRAGRRNDGRDPLCLDAAPCRTVEAWLLADDEAVNAVGDGPAMTPPPEPEELWGDPRDRASDHPKQVLRRRLGTKGGRREYVFVAQALRLDEVARRCPLSFAHFLAALRAL